MPTAKPLLHTATEAALKRALQRPPHAILLTGPYGVGKTAVGEWLAAELLGVEVVNQHPYFTAIYSPDGKAIGIDRVRELEHVLSLKIPGSAIIQRVVLLSDAHLLTGEAQNALLKTLEEPPQGTILVLTSSEEDALLPTIQSRVQTIAVMPPPRDTLAAALTDRQTANIPQILALSGGLPGLAFALAEGDQSHPLMVAATTARTLLQQSTFEKLCQVDTLAKNRELSRSVLYILMQMAHTALLGGRNNDRWQRIMQAAYRTESALRGGVQPKLALTELMLNL
jgi:replication-associated recombination protein RarA